MAHAEATTFPNHQGQKLIHFPDSYNSHASEQVPTAGLNVSTVQDRRKLHKHFTDEKNGQQYIFCRSKSID